MTESVASAIASMDKAYRAALRTPLEHYHEMVGWEQEWEEGGRTYDSALFRSIEEHGKVLAACEVIAKAFSKSVRNVYDDVEMVYTGC